MRFLNRKKRVGLLFLLLCLVFLPSLTLATYRFSEDADAIESVADSVFMLEVFDSNNQKIAVGSGFVVFDSSLLATNYHVIEGGAYIIAISDDGERHSLNQICVYNEAEDLALLRFETDPHATPLELDTTSQLKRSHTVVAIGSPAGLMNTISIGNISSFYTRDSKDWIQFTAPISSGSSGGALFNDQGKVIGITTATYASAQNINMAVKSQTLQQLYNQWDKKTCGVLLTDDVQDELSLASTVSHERVWCSSKGSKYHSNSSCSNMQSPYQIDLLDAIEQGYLPCGKCYR